MAITDPAAMLKFSPAVDAALAELGAIPVENPAKLDGAARQALLDSFDAVTAKLNAVAQGDELLLAKAHVVSADWSQEERGHFIEKGWRVFRDSERPMVNAFTRPTDYDHDLARGTVDHHDEWKNYCYHVVNIAPGSEITGRNFSQAVPNTPAIICDGELTLIECNLCNVALDKRWKLVACTTVQNWIGQIDDGKGGTVEKRQYLCAHPDQLTDIMLTPPLNAVVSRAF